MKQQSLTGIWIAIGGLGLALLALATYVVTPKPAAPIMEVSEETTETLPTIETAQQPPVLQGATSVEAPCSIVSHVVPGSSEVYIGWASSVATQGYVFERSVEKGDSYHVSTQIPGWFRAAAIPGTHQYVLQIIHNNEVYDCTTTYTVS